MGLLFLTWLTTCVILILLCQVQAAILHQQNQPIKNRLLQQHSPTLAPRPNSTSQLKQTLESLNQFILLTTGDQIKLYPFVNNTLTSSSNADLANNFYLIEPSKISTNSSDGEIIERFGYNALSLWLIEQKKRDNLLEKKKWNNILPNTFDTSNEVYAKSESGWKKPWIVDVDYFFDSDFCETKTNSCLVVIWLDKSNKFVRFGSINLSKSFEMNPSEKKYSKNRILSLNEFAPLDLISAFAQLEQTSSRSSVDIHEMVVDRRRKMIHIVLSSHVYSEYPNRVLSARIRPIKGNDSSVLAYAGDFKVSSFNNCPETSKLRFPVSLGGVKNLNLDEENGDWLFYFDKQEGGKIFALNLAQQQAATTNVDEDLSYATNATQLLVKDLSVKSATSTLDYTDLRENQNATGIVVDFKERRILWLNKVNELYSCNFLGKNTKLIAKLSYRPNIRSPHCLQLFKDTLLISDPAKKTLIAYKISDKDAEIDNLSTESDIFFEDFNEDELESIVKNNEKVSQLSKPTHQVILVEMPAIYGFRLIDLEVYKQRQDRDNVKQVRLLDTQNSFVFQDTNIEPTFVEKLEAYLVEEIQNNGDKKELDYEELMGRASPEHQQCGYLQSDYERTKLCKTEKLVLSFIEFIIILQILFSLYFVYKLCAYFKSKISSMIITRRGRHQSTTVIDIKETYKCQI